MGATYPAAGGIQGQVKAIIHDQSSHRGNPVCRALAVVELNNALREAVIAERDETRRVLAELSAQVGETGWRNCPRSGSAGRTGPGICQSEIMPDEIRATEPVLRDQGSGKGQGAATSSQQTQRS